MQKSSEPFWSIYGMFNLKLDGWKLTGVMWSAMPAQIPQLIALFLVVAFGVYPALSRLSPAQSRQRDGKSSGRGQN